MSFSKDVNSQNFDEIIIKGSQQVPVLVDFWAEWCAPCRVLKPILEKLAEDYQGGFLLAKVNTEENPSLAQRFQIRGIPDVRLFKNGEVVDSFTGAQGEVAIRALLDRFVTSPLDEFLTEAVKSDSPLATLESKFEEFKGNSKYLLALAQTQVKEQKYEEALATAKLVAANDDLYQEAEDVVTLVAFIRAAETTATATPHSWQQNAILAYTSGRTGEAIEELLKTLKGHSGEVDESTKKTILALLRQNPDPVKTRQYRQQFAAIINS